MNQKMTINLGEWIQISRTDLKSVDNSRLTGFSILNSRMNSSHVWQKIERIGLSSIEDEKQVLTRESDKADEFVGMKFKYEKFIGKVLLEIRGHGIREREFINGSVIKDRSITAYHRKVFKNEVYSSIKSFHQACGEYFDLLLHYNCGVMDRLEMRDTTKQ